MSSRVLEIEHRSATLCKFHPVQILPHGDNRWETIEETTTTEDNNNNTTLKGIQLRPGTTIRICPMDRKFGGWDDEHFNETLHLPDGEAGSGLVVIFEALCRECATIALSPTPSFQKGKTYECHFGANGNLCTVLRRHLPRNESVELSISGRVCSDTSYKTYWVVFHAGRLSVGMGAIPGRDCMGTLDDSLYDQLRPGQDAVRYVGIGNSVLGKYGRDVKVRNVVLCGYPPAGIVLSEPQMIWIGAEEEALAEYQRECEKARQRALKFEIDYVPPDPNQFLKWNEARKLRANPERGFITGIDLESTEEMEKRKRRRERFEKEGGDKVLEELEEDETKVEKVPMEEAWDMEDRVRDLRVDPPQSLWKKENEAMSSTATEEEMITEDDDGTDNDDMECRLVPEKIHIFAIDWAAFKQIRTEDIIAYFSSFGPKNHVEWLGELSANVIFEDKFSATRALQSLSQQLPPPPDKDKPDFAAMGWRFCLFPIAKRKTDRFGRRGTRSRLLLRIATSMDMLENKPANVPTPPPGYTTRKKLGPGDDQWDRVGEKANRKKRRKGRRQQPQSKEGALDEKMDDGDDVDDKLKRGLKSQREGFSVEQMEKERAVAASLVVKATNDATSAVGMDIGTKDNEEVTQ